MRNTKLLQEQYKNEKVFIVPVTAIQHIQDGFTPLSNDPKIWTRYDNVGRYIYRYEAEGQPVFQQIIPTSVIFSEDRDELYTATRIDGDNRLIGAKTLCFGGHVNEEDGFRMVVKNSLMRELHEELEITPLSKPIYMGTVRDIASNTNDHLGILFSITAKKDKVTVKETDRLTGKWMTKQELFKEYHKFENWSKFLIDHLFTSC